MLAIATLIFVSILWEENFSLTIIILLLGIAKLSIWRRKKYFYLYILTGIFGASAEIVAIHFGAWSYSNPSFLGIPIWLPFLWGSASTFIVSLLFEIDLIKNNLSQ